MKDGASFPATFTVWLFASFPAHLSSHTVQYGRGLPHIALVCAVSMAFSNDLSSSIALAAKGVFDGRVGSSLVFHAAP